MEPNISNFPQMGYTFNDGGARFMAAIIDAAVFILILVLASRLFPTTDLLKFIIIFITYITLQVFIPSKNEGQTIGKGVMGIKVINYDGTVPSFKKLLFRKVIWEISSITGIIILIIILASPKKQGLHDLLAKTYVVNAKAVEMG